MNDILTSIDVGSVCLAHYGVKGMRWGVRRYRPYPPGHVGGIEIGEAAKKKKPLDEKIIDLSNKLEERSINRGKKSRKRMQKSWKEFKAFCKRHKKAAKILGIVGIGGTLMLTAGAVISYKYMTAASNTIFEEFASIWR